MNDLEKFKKAVKKVRAGKVADGTVVKWKSSIYTYAAVFAGGNWWITGTGRFYGSNVFDSTTFINDVLAGAERVEIAVEWEEVN